MNAYASQLYVMMLISFLLGSLISLLVARFTLPSVKQLEQQSRDVLEGRE